ncbi:MAG: ATP-binding cassette domain-containing protein [Lentisphaerales bacterium]|nr:ATP-binding cassette domain-containing protein [Lentisphaerales bacterium]
MANKPLIRTQNLTLNFSKSTALLKVNWEVADGQNTVLCGPNGSGKTLLANFISGKLKVHKNAPLYREDFNPDNDIELVTFEYQQELFAIDDYNDDTDFLDYQDIGTTAAEIISHDSPDKKELQKVSELLELDYLLDRGIRFLSTGEMRKVLIARAMMNTPKLMIIDSPFEGLDQKSRAFLRKRLISLLKTQQCLLIINEDDPIIDHFDSVACLDKGELLLQGDPGKLKQSLKWQQLFKPHKPILAIPPKHHSFNNKSVTQTPLIEMKDVSVTYGEVKALNELSWKVMPGENWLISGPNGAGKSTLLSLVTADNPQGYKQDFHLFGRKRGSGETIWDIKRKIGIVTSALQLSYKVPLKALEVVLSGFFDSVGLYENADKTMVDLAEQWLDLLEIENIKNRYFSDLSYGEQRMVLLARAMVKHPLILILDEPCQGLDKANRTAILNLVDYIALNTNTTLLYVSHSHSEALQCINKRLNFNPVADRLFEAEISTK